VNEAKIIVELLYFYFYFFFSINQSTKIVRFNGTNRAGGIRVDGVLQARGTSGAPISFTGNYTTPAAGDWRGIYFSTLSTPATFFSNGTFQSGFVFYFSKFES
jgi:hypothetical protein